MKTLNKYLSHEMVKPSLAAGFVMLGLIWLLQSLRFMDLIVNKGLEVSSFLWITVLIIPNLLIIILPLAVFTGACFSFKRMTDDHETTAMFASGFNKTKIANPTVKVGIFTVVLCYILTMWLMPLGRTEFKEMQHDIRKTGNKLLLEEGTFNQAGKDLMVYIKKREGRKKLIGLLVHDSRKENKPVTWMAKEGNVIFSEDGFPQLVLLNGVRQEVGPEGLAILEFTKHTLDITRKIDGGDDRWRDEQERSLSELINPEPGVSEKDKKEFIAEFHKRFLWPLTPIPMILIAAAFILKPYGRHSGSAKHTAIASVTAVIYQIAVVALHSLSTKGSAAILYGQWLLPIVVSFICLMVIKERVKN